MRIPPIAVACVVAVAACGPDVVPIGEINARYAEAYCQWLVRCGDFDTMARCLAFQRELGPVTPSVAAAVAVGFVDYDAVQAAECLDQRATMSCSRADETVRTQPSAICRGMLRAGRKMGDDCAIDEECFSRNCLRSACTPETCCTGTCGEPFHQAKLGEDCTAQPCAPDGWCAAGNCAPLLPRGTACYRSDQCAFGLDCLGTCQPPLAVGDPCSDVTFPPTCGTTLGLTCDPVTSTCQPVVHQGDPCTTDDRCASGYLICGAISHVCEPLPAIGEPCAHGNLCGAGAYCNFPPFQDGVCLPYIDDGSPCFGAGAACKSGTCGSDGKCITPPVCK